MCLCCCTGEDIEACCCYKWDHWCIQEWLQPCRDSCCSCRNLCAPIGEAVDEVCGCRCAECSCTFGGCCSCRDVCGSCGTACGDCIRGTVSCLKCGFDCAEALSKIPFIIMGLGMLAAMVYVAWLLIVHGVPTKGMKMPTTESLFLAVAG